MHEWIQRTRNIMKRKERWEETRRRAQGVEGGGRGVWKREDRR